MARTIVLFSTKGGVGKSLIASNLAVSLATEEQKKILLLDLDLQAAGDMSRMLGLNPDKAMVDLLPLLEAGAAEIPKEEFLIHSNFGVDLLAGVLKPQQTPYIEFEKISDVFALFEPDYDYIIVDAGKIFSEGLAQALNQANLILLVLTPDILCVYQTKWALDTLQFLQFPLSMVRLVLNRAASAASISWQEVRYSLPVDIIAQIPSEGRVAMEAVNKGIPVVINSPKAKISLTLKKFAHQLTSAEKLFIKRQQIDQLRFKEAGLQRPEEFWQSQGLASPSPKSETLTKRDDEITLLKRRIHNRLIEQMNLKRLDLKVFSDPKKTKELRDKAEVVVVNLLADEAGSLISSADVRRNLVKEILDEALGLGPLEDLLADPEITDIMVNNKDEVFIEKHGKIELTHKRFLSNDQVRTVIERIIAPIGRRIDESVPMVDARLADGSRVNAIIPPLSLTGPSLTIRKFRSEIFKAEDLVKLNTLSTNMVDFLKVCVLSHRNIIVSGGTGSGKTTVLNVLSEFMPSNERIITIEDAAELKLHQEHWVRLESRPANIEGRGAISASDLFRNTLRMRPDRIIIGECRGVETLDMLQAMNTGHDGSMTTVHANSTQDVLVRLDSMILMSGIELPVKAIREMIASAVDLIIHTARLSDGTRKIVQITEIVGMKDELHIGMEDIFIFKQTGLDPQENVLGHFTATGYSPTFSQDVKVRGIPLSEHIFKPTPNR